MFSRNALVGALMIFLAVSTAQGASVFSHAKSVLVDGFDTTGLAILAVGIGATAVAFGQDQNIHDAWVNHQRMSGDVSGFGNFWGTGIPEAGIAAAQLVFDTEKGVVDTEGLLASTAVTYGMKYATQRSRPDSDSHNSFPSGHTQISFASATHIAVAYGWLASVPSYSLAVFTGLSRLADNAHWFSDVVAGAAVGTFFGRAGFKHHFSVRPFTFDDGSHGYGLTVSWRF